MILAMCGVSCVFGMAFPLAVVGGCKAIYARKAEKDAVQRIQRVVANKPF